MSQMIAFAIWPLPPFACFDTLPTKQSSSRLSLNLRAVSCIARRIQFAWLLGIQIMEIPCSVAHIRFMLSHGEYDMSYCASSHAIQQTTDGRSRSHSVRWPISHEHHGPNQALEPTSFTAS